MTHGTNNLVGSAMPTLPPATICILIPVLLAKKKELANGISIEISPKNRRRLLHTGRETHLKCIERAGHGRWLTPLKPKLFSPLFAQVIFGSRGKLR